MYGTVSFDWETNSYRALNYCPAISTVTQLDMLKCWASTVGGPPGRRTRYSRTLTFLPCCIRLQVADALSTLGSVGGAVRVSRFDHSSLSDYDLTSINTEDFKMEYVVHFEGAGRPDDLPLLTYNRMDSVNCGKVFWGVGGGLYVVLLAERLC